MTHSLTIIGRHFDCAIQAEMVAELGLALKALTISPNYTIPTPAVSVLTSTNAN